MTAVYAVKPPDPILSLLPPRIEPLMPRTKSLLFDDDVVSTFAPNGELFAIDDVIARYQAGTVSKDIARRAISQCMVALVAVDEKEGGWSINHMMQMCLKISQENPHLYDDEALNPSKEIK